MQQSEEISALRDQLRRTEAVLQGETARHAGTAKALAEAEKSLERLAQQVADTTERLEDNEAHRASLEEKHQHARSQPDADVEEE